MTTSSGVLLPPTYPRTSSAPTDVLGFPAFLLPHFRRSHGLQELPLRRTYYCDVCPVSVSVERAVALACLELCQCHETRTRGSETTRFESRGGSHAASDANGVATAVGARSPSAGNRIQRLIYALMSHLRRIVFHDEAMRAESRYQCEYFLKLNGLHLSAGESPQRPLRLATSCRH
jgi:hypothetical protein